MRLLFMIRCPDCEHEFQQFNVVCITDFATKYGHPYGRRGQVRHRTGG